MKCTDPRRTMIHRSYHCGCADYSILNSLRTLSIPASISATTNPTVIHTIRKRNIAAINSLFFILLLRYRYLESLAWVLLYSS